MRKFKLVGLIAVTASVLTLATGCLNTVDKNQVDTKDAVKTQESQAETENIAKIFQDMDTKDLNEEKVTKDIFAKTKLTMINIWATWCGPCVEEIPELEKVANEYKEDDVAVKGLLIEIDGKTGMPMAGLTENEKVLAEDILKKAGATYQQLLVSQDMKEPLSTIDGFPTTYFVNEKGELVGEPVMGSNSKDDWKKIIEERLKMLEEK